MLLLADRISLGEPRLDLGVDLGVDLGRIVQAEHVHLVARRDEVDAPEAELRLLGVFPYRQGKDLALYAWAPRPMPDPRTLVCASQFSWKGRMWPEFDRFGLFTHKDALERVGKSLAILLGGISLAAQ